MNFFIGTSGYGYKEWKGKFYPPDLKPADMLPFYAERFNAVEINNTFYRMPSEDLIRSWTKQVPANFTFILKAPQKITHSRRLKNVADDLATFLDVADALKKRRGPLLFQFPANFKKDLTRLADFLKLIPRRYKPAFEFRSETWFDDETFATLKKHDAALCIAESEDTVQVPFVATADWGYLRLRRLDYTKPALKRWRKKIESQQWSNAYTFFKHEDKALGPKFAATFKGLA